MTQFSQLFLCTRRERQPHADRYDDQLEEVRLVEELGYDCAWFGEHHFAGYGLIGNTLTMAAAASRITSRIALGAGVVVLPWHHPVRVAEEVAMVDCLSHGRLRFGVGRGYQPHEFRGFGQRMEDSLERFTEAVNVIQRLFREDDVSFQGKYWQGEHVTIWPKPVQRPHPPIWAAALSEESFVRYARFGWPILTFPSIIPVDTFKRYVGLYRREFTAAGHDPARMRIAFTAFTYLAPTREEADRDFEAGMTQYFGLLDRITRLGAQQAEAAHQVYHELPSTGRITGTPDDAIQRVRWAIDTFGVTDFINVTQYAGYLTHKQITRSLRLFGQHVIPAFQGAGSVAGPTPAAV